MDINMESLKKYIGDLLELIAEEVNIKEIRLEHEYATSVYRFDTVKGESTGLDDEWPLYALIFSGDIHDDMNTVKEFCRIGLKQRSEAKIKVRQPLQSITLKV